MLKTLINITGRLVYVKYIIGNFLLKHIFCSIFAKRPIQCSYFVNQNTKQYLNKFDFDKYDIIIIFLTRLSSIIEFIKDKNKIIFDMADILTINYKNAWKAKGLALKWKIIYSIEYFLIRMEETKDWSLDSVTFYTQRRKAPGR